MRRNFYDDGIMNVDEATQALERAKAELQAHHEKQKNYPVGACLHGWMHELDCLSDAVLEAERRLSAARKEEYAEIWDDVPLLRGKPLPRVFHRDPRRLTVFAAVAYIPPEWKGKTIGENPGYTDDSPVVRIEFRDAQLRWTKGGSAEIERHPLLERGLNSSRPMRIANSRWKGRGRHHLLMFESASLEILGSADPVEVWSMTLDEASAQCGGRLDPGPA
jgi:hypothetical protein